MNITINQLWVTVAILLLTSCSMIGETKITPQEASQLAKAKKSSTLEMCKPDIGSPHAYRKAILISGTTIVNNVAGDLPGLENLVSQRLQTHLNKLERFKVLTVDKAFNSGDTQTSKHVRQISNEYASQFVIKLDIQDLTLHSPEGYFGELFTKKRREVQIKLLIYDAEHGALFYSQQYQGSVSGNVYGYPGKGSLVSTALFSTDLGMKIDDILKSMSKQINEQLACVPFTAKVIAVRGGDIHINAGYLHGIKPKEALRIYHRREVRIGNKAQNLEQKGDWIQIKTVFPNQSIAKTKDSSLVTRGDIVRAW